MHPRSRLPEPVLLDTGFLAAQTFADRDLERELLILFEAQCGRLVPILAGDGPIDALADAAHTLAGAALAIGARRIAGLAADLEQALREGRPDVGPLRRRLDTAARLTRALVVDRAERAREASVLAKAPSLL